MVSGSLKRNGTWETYGMRRKEDELVGENRAPDYCRKLFSC
jgi:hypothetical protein